MKSTQIIRLLGLASLFISTFIFADYTLSGTVKDQTTGQTIPDANITLAGTDLGAASQDGGRFFIHSLKADTYQINAHVIGYAPYQSGKIALKEDTEVLIELTPQTVELNPVIVTATLSEHLKSNVTVASDVYTSSQLRQMNGHTAGEILELSTGAYFRSYDGLAGNQIPSIRGSNTDQVVVLLDDIRLNTAQGGGVDLNLFPVQALDRIEVIRGGHSALLGSDAMGGAIHLISNKNLGANGYTSGVQYTMGSFGTQLTNARFAQRIGKFSILTHYSQSQSDGDFEFSPLDTSVTMTRENNDSRGSGLFVKSAWQFNMNHEVRVLYNKVHQEKGIAGSVNKNAWTGARDLTPEARSDLDQRMMAISFDDQWTALFKTKAQVYMHAHDYHFTDPAGWTPTDDKHQNDVTGVKVQGAWQAISSINLQAGADVRQEKLTSTRYDADKRSMNSVFGQIEYIQQLNDVRLTLIPAVRYDDYSDVGSHTSPKLGMLLTVGSKHQLGLRSNVSQSFRVPTLNDLYWPADQYTAGNPDLKPETAQNLDVGLMYSLHSDLALTFESTWFRNDVEDLILWAARPDFVWTPQNVGKAAISGFEISLRAVSPCKLFTFRISHTNMKATDETSGSENWGKRLIYRPDNKFDFWMGFNKGPINSSINYRVVSKSYTDALNTNSLDGYKLLNLSLGGDVTLFGTQVNTNLQINNALDKGIYISDGYPLPGRSYRVTVGMGY